MSDEYAPQKNENAILLDWRGENRKGGNKLQMKHISTSHLKSQLRQAQRKTQQAVNQYNSAVRKYNSEVNRYNRELNQAISNYNSGVRQYNSQVQHNRQVIKREFAKLSTSTMHIRYSSTVSAMQSSYSRVISIYDTGNEITPEQEIILNLAEQEQANSLIATNRLFNENGDCENDHDEIEDVAISDRLSSVSVDLMNRWKGAVYALSPLNPDAARHFCTSAREIFTEFIELKAPDESVFQFNPNAAKTERGNATRKEKIRYMMSGKELDGSVLDFADADIENILELFHVLSDGTHGEAGKYEFDTLVQVKRRVEQGINFLCTISA